MPLCFTNMDKVFDLREFILLLLKKGKLFIIFAVVLGFLGGAFGFLNGGDELYICTTSASVNTQNDGMTDATALTSIMTSVKDTLSSDFFYTGIFQAIFESMTQEQVKLLFGNVEQPTVESLKNVIKLYVKGNLVLVDVTGEKQVVEPASELARGYVMGRLTQNINNIILEEEGKQVIKQSVQTGDTAKSRTLKFGILGFGGGLVLAALWIFFFDVMSVRVKKAEDLKRYGLPVFSIKELDASVLQEVLLSAVASASKGGAGVEPLVIGLVSSAAETTPDSTITKLASAIADCGHIAGLTTKAVVDTAALKSIKQAKEFCAACKSEAEVTIVPIGAVVGEYMAMGTAAAMDGVLLYESAASSRTDRVEKALDILHSLKVTPLGFILSLRKQ